MNEKIKLTCVGFEVRAPNILQNILSDQDLSDVTLATDDGQQILAHKVILGTRCGFFKKILQQNVDANPLIYFSGLTNSVLRSLVDFMYLGRCQVREEELEEFICIGRELDIKGIDEIGLVDLANILNNETYDDYPEESKHGINISENIKVKTKSTQLQDDYEHEDIDMTDMDFGLKMPEVFVHDQDMLNNKDDEADFNGVLVDKPKPNKYVLKSQDGKFSLVKLRPSTHTKNIEKQGKCVPQKAVNPYFIGETAIKTNLACDVCSFTTKRRDHLNQHKIGKHGGQQYECNQCEFKATYNSQINRHKAEKHRGQMFSCVNCGYQTPRRDNLKKHRTSCKEAKLMTQDILRLLD